MSPGTVVRETPVLDEQSFHDRLTAGWGRCIPLAGGRSKFALAVGMTTRGLDKVLAGSTPHACTILNSRRAHASALDELMAGYGVRMVPAGAACSTDDHAGLALLRAAAKCIEAEADGEKNHVELLGMEPELRDAQALIAGMLARIDQIRGVK